LIDGFLQKSVRALFEKQRLKFGRCFLTRDHDDENSPKILHRFDLAADVRAVAVGQNRVEQNQIRHYFVTHADRVRAGHRFIDLITRATDDALVRRQNIGVVLNNQYS
jgi:hypothetical protein